VAHCIAHNRRRPPPAVAAAAAAATAPPTLSLSLSFCLTLLCHCLALPSLALAQSPVRPSVYLKALCCRSCCCSCSALDYSGSQRCQINFFKSARSDVKIRQNPPFSISQIRQKSAKNPPEIQSFLYLFFTPWGSVLFFLLRIWPNLRSGRGEIFFYL
jgi:hypothetical protein